MAEQGISTNGKRPSLPPRQLGRRTQALHRMAALGEAVTVMMRAPKHKAMPLEGLRVQVLPAIVHDQYLIARVNPQEGRQPVAAGFVMWASVSAEVDARLRANPQQPIWLRFEEWKSGPHLWLVDLVAPTALAGAMLADLEKKIGKGQPISARISAADGITKIMTVKDVLAGMKKQPA
jgi:cytolysin-activating lysine-acyltransferase